jgi:P27 family predicted phage terminase small subunit
MKGRKPTPVYLKVLTGNPGKKALNTLEPKPPRGKPNAPAHLSDKAREAWSYVSDHLDRMGALTKVDALALEALCEAYADYLAARATLAEFGSNYYETVNAQGGVMHRPHPAVAVMQDADRRIKAWFVEFGMTPSSRSRIQVGNGEANEDPSEKYFSA